MKKSQEVQDIENEEDNGFWAKGSFSETLSSKEAKEKLKTIHKKHNEDMSFNCKKCNVKISAHNKDWHDEMCDDCFNKKYFPDTQYLTGAEEDDKTK